MAIVRINILCLRNALNSSEHCIYSVSIFTVCRNGLPGWFLVNPSACYCFQLPSKTFFTEIINFGGVEDFCSGMSLISFKGSFGNIQKMYCLVFKQIIYKCWLFSTCHRNLNYICVYICIFQWMYLSMSDDFTESARYWKLIAGNQ